MALCDYLREKNIDDETLEDEARAHGGGGASTYA
jgi:hypothetical protein